MINIKNINDVQNLISKQIEENLHLDYKASGSLGKSDGKKREITKDVSAFANSDGGVIIYGVKEFTVSDKKHLPEHIDPIDRNEFSKEWLEQVVNNISPRIDNIIIIPIPIDNESNKVIYVVSIKKSSTAHQAMDYRYYKRYNFESIMMYDFEIRDIMNRSKFPKIKLIFNIEQYYFDQPTHLASITTPIKSMFEGPIKTEKKLNNTLYVYGLNIGNVYANYVNCFISIPTAILDESEYKYLEKYTENEIEYCDIYCDNTIREIKEYASSISSSKYWPSRYEPILPGLQLKLKKISLKSDVIIDYGLIKWIVNADNSEKLDGNIRIEEIKTNIREK